MPDIKDELKELASAFGKSARESMISFCYPFKKKYNLSDKQFNEMMKVDVKVGYGRN